METPTNEDDTSTESPTGGAITKPTGPRILFVYYTYTQQSRKVAHAQKKTGRKTRPADSDDRAVVPGYGSGPPFTTSERRPLLGSADDDRRNTGRPTQYGSPPSGFFRW